MDAVIYNNSNGDTIMATQVQKTIVEQMGGKKFMMMTGCKKLLIDGERPAVTFEIGSGAKKRIKYVKVELMGDDTYTMTLSKIFKFEHKILATHEGVYFDMLQDIFTQETGMYTSL